MLTVFFLRIYFSFNDTPTTEIYTLSLHDALPISYWSSYYHFNYSGYRWRLLRDGRRWRSPSFSIASWRKTESANGVRSEERFSRNAETDLVCRLLLEKNKVTVAVLAVVVLAAQSS